MRASWRFWTFLWSLDSAYLLLAMAFILVLNWPAAWQQPVNWLDQRLLAAAYSLTPAPANPVRVAVAQLPKDMMTDFVNSPSTDPLGQKLMALHQQGINFHVFLPSAFRPQGFYQPDDIQLLLASMQIEPEADLVRADVVGRLKAIQNWQRFSRLPDIHWFLPRDQIPPSSGSILTYQSSSPVWSLEPLQWIAGLANKVEGTVATRDGQFGHYDFLGPRYSDNLPLWWQGEDRQKVISAPLLLAQQIQALGNVRWSDGALQSEQKPWHRSVNARGNLPVDWRLAPVSLSLSAAEARRQEFDLLLIAQEGNLDPQISAAVMNTLLADHYPKAPVWAWAWVPFIILILAAVTRPIWLRTRTAVLLLSLVVLSMALVAVQIAAQVVYQWWLPMGAAMLFLWCAVLLRAGAALWLLPHINLRESWRTGWQQIVREQINTGKLAEAENNLLALSECRGEAWQLQITYDLAQTYEKQRRYDQAEKLYQSILSRSSRFADVKQRLTRLQELSGNQSSAGLDATLVIDEQIINKPVLGRYEIQKELGRGAMGVVYLGRDPRISRMVAIKTLHYKHFEPAQLIDVKARFFREAEAAGRLSHPNIVSVFDAGEEEDLAFIAMDYVPGKALNYFTHPKRLLPVPIVYGLMAKAADALYYAHKHQIIHRDIKPSNLLYDPETGRIKVSDFGIARLVDNSKTRTGDVMGSPLYMSPEQLKGVKVTESADIYSLGVTMYQLLTGKLPFDGDSLANLTYQILQGKHASVRTHRPDLPASATRITNKALQIDSADRFQDAREMAEAIRKSLARDFEKE